MNTTETTRSRTIGGRYTLLSPVGSFGPATVWRARDPRRDQDVAVQEVVIPPGASATERQHLCARSIREARTAAVLRHPSVVPICDVVVDGDRPWVVMEFLAARSLDEIVRDDGPLPYPVVADIALHVLAGLDTAHRAGILHRDVRPSNVLIGKGFWAILTGFGAARTSGDAAMTSAGLALCAPPYVPPERARGVEATAASDLWSLGATLFTAVEGRPPFDAGDPMPTLAAILDDAPVEQRRAGPLAPILAGLLEKDPRRRWDLERARSGLRAVLAGVDPTGPASDAPAPPGPSAMPPAPAARPQPPPAHPGHPAPALHRASPLAGRRWPRWLAAAAAALACLLLSTLFGARLAASGPPNIDKAAPATGARPVGSSPAQGPAAPLAAGPAASGPATYARYQHDGFFIDVPRGWSRQTQSNGDVRFRDPHGRILGLQRVGSAATTIRRYWDAADAATSSQPGYRLIGIRSAKLGGRTGADWEFTRIQGTGATATTHRTVGRGIILDNTAYIIYLSTVEREFAASRPVLDRVAASFQLSR